MSLCHYCKTSTVYACQDCNNYNNVSPIKYVCYDCLFHVYPSIWICLDCVLKHEYKLTEKDQLRAGKFYQLDSQKYRDSETEFKTL